MNALLSGRSAGNDPIHALHHIFPMTGLSGERTRLNRLLIAFVILGRRRRRARLLLGS